MLFDTAKNCICNGPCAAACNGKSQLCGGAESPAACIMCEDDPQHGCGTQTQACTGDHG
jgi:hypothetical protein